MALALVYLAVAAATLGWYRACIRAERDLALARLMDQLAREGRCLLDQKGRG